MRVCGVRLMRTAHRTRAAHLNSAQLIVNIDNSKTEKKTTINIHEERSRSQYVPRSVS